MDGAVAITERNGKDQLIDRLKEEIRQLRVDLKDRDYKILGLKDRIEGLNLKLENSVVLPAGEESYKWPYLTPGQSRLAHAFLKYTTISRETAYNAVSANSFNSANPPADRIIDVYICHLRKRLKERNPQALIITSYRQYTLSPEARALLLETCNK